MNNEQIQKIKEHEKKHGGKIDTLIGPANVFYASGSLGQFMRMDDIWYRQVGSDWIALGHGRADSEIGYILGCFFWDMLDHIEEKQD
ncbi:MAG: hypothetical protein EA366_12275 [Spirulina sp. DLM2.Bin59]|nr:MAG: hypothetical protein EA366_12275 [Spirulina sp. DLM2.Bin59]